MYIPFHIKLYKTRFSWSRFVWPYHTFDSQFILVYIPRCVAVYTYLYCNSHTFPLAIKSNINSNFRSLSVIFEWQMTWFRCLKLSPFTNARWILSDLNIWIRHLWYMGDPSYIRLSSYYTVDKETTVNFAPNCLTTLGWKLFCKGQVKNYYLSVMAKIVSKN